MHHRALTARLCKSSTENRGDRCDKGITVITGGCNLPTETCRAAGFNPWDDEFPDGIQDTQRAHIGFTAGRSPREQTMRAENHTITTGILGDGGLKPQSKLKARALPWQPDEVDAFRFPQALEEGWSICGCSKRNRPVRVEVVDVALRDKCVERCINRWCSAVLPKCAEGVERNHFIFEVQAAVTGLQGFQLVLVERRKARALDGAKVATGTFNPEDIDGRASDGIDTGNLRGCVSAAKVGQAWVAAKEV